MDWDKLDKDITESPRYKFFKKHERAITAIEGLIVIGLLVGIIMFTIQDYDVKQQISERCGYTTSKYECVCDPVLVEGWKEFKESGMNTINISDFVNG